MKKHVIFFTVYCPFALFVSVAQAAAIIDIIPSSASPIVLSPSGFTYLTYTAKNKTSKALSGITIEPNYGASNVPLKIFLNNNQCGGITLVAGGTCSFIVSIQGLNQFANLTLMPRICGYNGAICSTPVLSDRVSVLATNALPNNTFPTPYAGTYYPIYNSGTGQWLPPDQAPIPPFTEVSAIFVAFAHTYPQGNGAIFTYEEGQPSEPERLTLLSQSARAANPNVKILISLGWGKYDWTYINTDYVNHANIFVPSVVQFIRNNRLDGLDIDDEGIGDDDPGGSGTISQANFNGVIANLRNALNTASLQDGKPYYLTITPAGNNQDGGLVGTQVDSQNASSFNLINIQSYYNGDPDFGEDFFNALIAIGYPQGQISNGIDTQPSCTPDYPPYLGLAGMFNWNMTADSVCGDYDNTETIANLVGY
ncbi:MAG: glycoside hydrolase family 18 protein [Legionellaceae bacterium]|nr:glycoside hydrolase family 18 protein [Legionellaceae bacterium]